MKQNELIEEHRPELLFSLYALCLSISNCLLGGSWRRLKKVRGGWRTLEEVGRVEKVLESWRGSGRTFWRKFVEQVGTSRGDSRSTVSLQAQSRPQTVAALGAHYQVQLSHTRFLIFPTSHTCSNLFTLSPTRHFLDR